MNISRLDEIQMRSDKYKKKKFKKITKALAKNVFGNLAMEQDEMIPQFKAKFAQAKNRREKIAILSCLPKAWNAHKISSEFQVSHRMAQKTKDLVDEYGILLNSTKRSGSMTLPDETINLVKGFYRNDEINRACPGLRDYVTHKENGEKQTIQRRMVLVNLSEAFELFKEKHKDIKVGFSKFASLRPPECVLAMEKYGTHSTCVCCYHQNVKLIFESLKRNGLCDNFSNYRDVIELMLCDVNYRTNACHLSMCDNCPGKQHLESMSTSELEEALMDQF